MQNIEITNDEMGYIIALCQAEVVSLKCYTDNFFTSTATSYSLEITVEEAEERVKVLQGFLDKINKVYEDAV